MDWSTTTALAARWQDETRCYVAAINDYVARGMALGWDNAGTQPADTRAALAEPVLAVVRAANRAGEVEALHAHFPPESSPFLSEARTRHIGPVVLLDDDRVVVRAGPPWAPAACFVLDNFHAVPLPDVVCVGRSPDRRYIAIARAEHVTIHDGWEGPVVCTLVWPTGREGLPTEAWLRDASTPPPVTQLIPFPDGARALLVSSIGVFVLTVDGAVPLHPGASERRERYDEDRQEYPDEPVALNIDMEHGALSADGQLIAVGSQDSEHLLFDAELRLVGRVPPASSYPHAAVFSADGRHVAFNSCHFYNGETVSVLRGRIPAASSEPTVAEDAVTLVDPSCRVYAAVGRDDTFLLGDAYGYVRACGLDGTPRWQHFFGGTIAGMDLSRDGTTLAVSTYAGVVHLLDLDTGEVNPYVIGTTTHRERRRWMFWPDEPQPLVW
jgi:hypothetical protein